MTVMLPLFNFDPTRTLTLRDKFVKEYRRRFGLLIAVIHESIVTNNCFELKVNRTIAPGELDGLSESAKLNQFMDWLEAEYKDLVLGMPKAVSESQVLWSDNYIKSAYAQGSKRGRQEIVKAGGTPAVIGDNADLFDIEYHDLAYNDVKKDNDDESNSILDDMLVIIALALAALLASRLSKKDTFDTINKIITGNGEMPDVAKTVLYPEAGVKLTPIPGMTKSGLPRSMPALRRAEITARTEIVKAHHIATVTEYKAAGAEWVEVMAEFTTAGDERVCVECAELEDRRYPLSEIVEMIPVHPQCRCLAVPIFEGN